MNHGRNGSPRTEIAGGDGFEGSLSAYATTPLVVPTKTNGYAAARHVRRVPPAPDVPRGDVHLRRVETVRLRWAAGARRLRARRSLACRRRTHGEAAGPRVAGADLTGARRGAVGVEHAAGCARVRVARVRIRARLERDDNVARGGVRGGVRGRGEARVAARRPDLRRIEAERTAVDDRARDASEPRAEEGARAQMPRDRTPVQKAPRTTAPPSEGARLTTGSARGFGDGHKTSAAPPTRNTPPATKATSVHVCSPDA